MLDSRLSWKFHIKELSKKLSRAVGLLYKIRLYTPKNILRSLYFAIFHSHLTYGLPVWGFADQKLIDNIILLPKKALWAITYADFNAHTYPIMKKLNILSVMDQRNFMISSLMWDLDHSMLPPLSALISKNATLFILIIQGMQWLVNTMSPKQIQKSMALTLSKFMAPSLSII